MQEPHEHTKNQIITQRLEICFPICSKVEVINTGLSAFIDYFPLHFGPGLLARYWGGHSTKVLQVSCSCLFSASQLWKLLLPPMLAKEKGYVTLSLLPVHTGRMHLPSRPSSHFLSKFMSAGTIALKNASHFRSNYFVFSFSSYWTSNLNISTTNRLNNYFKEFHLPLCNWTGWGFSLRPGST